MNFLVLLITGAGLIGLGFLQIMALSMSTSYDNRTPIGAYALIVGAVLVAIALGGLVWNWLT